MLGRGGGGFRPQGVPTVLWHDCPPAVLGSEELATGISCWSCRGSVETLHGDPGGEVAWRSVPGDHHAMFWLIEGGL